MFRAVTFLEGVGVEEFATDAARCHWKAKVWQEQKAKGQAGDAG